MAPRKVPNSQPSASGGEPSTSTTTAHASTSALQSHKDHPPTIGSGPTPTSSGLATTASINPAERTGDDQQISQILAEMAQQNTHGPLHPNSSSRSSTSRPGRSRQAPLSHEAPGSPERRLAVSDVPIAPSEEPVPSAASHTPQTGGGGGGDVTPLVEQDELEGDGEGEGVGTTQGRTSVSVTSETSNKGKTKTARSNGAGSGSVSDKRSRGNGNEHKGMTEEEWERSRKANHKEVERRRRETINAGLDSLAALLPPVLPSAVASNSDASTSITPGTSTGGGGGVRGSKPNKSEILGRGIQYIQDLKQERQSDLNQWTLEKLLKDQEIKKLNLELDKAKQLNEELKGKIERLEQQQLRRSETERGEGTSLGDAFFDVGLNGEQDPSSLDQHQQAGERDSKKRRIDQGDDEGTS